MDKSRWPGGTPANATKTNHPSQNSSHRRRFNESPIERAKRELGSMRDLLANHGHQIRGQNVRCPSPNHGDRHPSASVYIGRNSDERIHCFSCNFDGDVIDVARALGMIVEIGAPERKLRCHRSPLRPISRAEAEMLANRPDFAFDWTLAITLARVPEILARLEVLHSWDFLTEHCDLTFVLRLSQAVRGIAFLRYGSPRDQDGWRAVDRLMREVAA